MSTRLMFILNNIVFKKNMNNFADVNKLIAHSTSLESKIVNNIFFEISFG